LIQIRGMTAADVPLGMRLKAQAGWNQTEADWQRFLVMQPEGCFVAEVDGVPVGTTVACIFESVAWIAMVLVDKEHRSRGVGKALMQHALAFLDRHHIPTVRLDATPLGQPLYEKLGFAVEYSLARYEGVVRPVDEVVTEPKTCVTSATRRHWLSLVGLDRGITSTDRRKFLILLFQERPDEVRMVERTGHVSGYMTIRSGTEAVQLGPCLGWPLAGLQLLADASHRYAGQKVFIDIPTGNGPAIRMAEQMGLQVQRQLVRMYQGVPLPEDCSRLFASSGPELG
jgi:GNAT superfamily N-acetyltransferase